MRPNRHVIRAVGATTVAALAAVAFATVLSAATQVAPLNTAPPTITGTPQVGQALTAGDGTWANVPTSYAYQWLRCKGDGNGCKNVANGAQKVYTLVSGDAGRTMRVRVTATNADGAGSAESKQTVKITSSPAATRPRNTVAPAITGTAKVGLELTTTEGTWLGSPTSFAFAWQRCDADGGSCTSVSGATGKTYGVRLADLGYRLRIAVTARNAKGSTTARSALTAIVTPIVRITNHRPTLTILSIRFAGATVYARFRICDDSMKNLTILATDSRPGVASYTRRFTTLIAPRPCGVYTRHWLPVARFRGPGKYTVTLRARDKSALTSVPARRSFMR